VSALDGAPRSVLREYPQVGSEVRVEPLGHGLINETYAVDDPAGQYVLQRVHPAFSARIHENIAAVTERLATRGVPTPRLCAAMDGRLWVEHEGRVWRLMTRLAGVSFDAVASPVQARAAGGALGRFHGALADLDHTFVGMRTGVHDTPGHLAHLRDCLQRHGVHRLHAAVAGSAERLFELAEVLDPVTGVPDRIVHGDPKFNNVLFEGEDPEASLRAVGLVDLDTVGPMPLHLELGDAWRSWCNRTGEDEEEAAFDLDVFEASLQGWSAAAPFVLEPNESEALLHGVEWITLELAARFLADALTESYFGWDPSRFRTRGEHNLVRARGQLALHTRVMACRSERAAILARCV
jgi:Ser/Thr protein kinase RdoA (MazF antagonist)